MLVTCIFGAEAHATSAVYNPERQFATSVLTSCVTCTCGAEAHATSALYNPEWQFATTAALPSYELT